MTMIRAEMEGYLLGRVIFNDRIKAREDIALLSDDELRRIYVIVRENELREAQP